MKYFPDHLGNKLQFSTPPIRIVSLVPSQTELLADLGLEEQVVGITKFCIHPTGWLKRKKIIGGTKNFHFETIEALTPDLILANKEENYKEGIDQLRRQHPVWISDVTTWADSLNLIIDVGSITGRKEKANDIVQSIEDSFLSLRRLSNRLSVLYLIWKNPWMGAAPGTFIHTMLEKVGFRNCLETHSRYPELSKDDIRALSPDVILLSSEPFPFKSNHCNELKAICPQSRVMLADGEMFSWFGSRQAKAAGYFKQLLEELPD